MLILRRLVSRLSGGAAFVPSNLYAATAVHRIPSPLVIGFKAPQRHFLTSIQRRTDNDSYDNDDDDQAYWRLLNESFEEHGQQQQQQENKQQGVATTSAEKRVFVLQLRMQFKSKSRQSTRPELQLAESISLVHTLANWRVVDSLIIGTKRSFSANVGVGTGNQEMLAKRLAALNIDVLFVVIDRLARGQVEAVRRSLLGNSERIRVIDRFTLVLEIFKQNARSHLAKLQIALAQIPYMRHAMDNDELFKVRTERSNLP